MEKHELFKIELEEQQAFAGYDVTVLLSVGIQVGNSVVSLKKLYKVYMNGDSSYVYKPRRGANIEFLFNSESDEITIKQLEKKLKFTEDLFLKYLNLTCLCFHKIYPIGSVVELDEDMLDDDFKTAFGKEGKPFLAMITGCRVSLPGELDDYIADYVGRLRPFGEGEQDSFFISDLLIKRVIHTGYFDTSDEEFMMKKIENIISNQKRLMTFITRKDEEVLTVEVMRNLEGIGVK